MTDLDKLLTMDEGQNVKIAAEYIALNSFRGVVVIDKNNIVKGVLTEGDILRFYLKQGRLSAPVSALLTTNYIKLVKNYNSVDLLNLVKKGLTIIPVVDEKGMLLEVLGLKDL